MSAFRAVADSSPALNSFPSDFSGIQLVCFKARSPGRLWLGQGMLLGFAHGVYVVWGGKGAGCVVIPIG